MDAGGYRSIPLGGSPQQPSLSQGQNSQSFLSQPNNVIPLEIRKKIQMMLLLRHTTIGCLVSSIQDEYKVCYGEDIFPEMYGYNSWLDVLRAMPDDVSIETLRRHHVVIGNRLTHSLTLDYLGRVFNSSSSTPSTPVNSMPLFSQNNSIVDYSIHNEYQSGNGSQILENSQTSENQIPSGNLHNHSPNSSTATDAVDHNSVPAITGKELSHVQVDSISSHQTPKPIDRTNKLSPEQNGQSQKSLSSPATATISQAPLISSPSQFQSTPHRTMSCAGPSNCIPVIDLSDDMDDNLDLSAVPVDQDVKNVVTSLIPGTWQSLTGFAPDIAASVAASVPESTSIDASNDIQMQVDVDIKPDFNAMSDLPNEVEPQPPQMVDVTPDVATTSIVTNNFLSCDSIHIDVNPGVNSRSQNNPLPPQNSQSFIPTQFHPPPSDAAVVIPDETSVMEQANPPTNENVPQDVLPPANAVVLADTRGPLLDSQAGEYAIRSIHKSRIQLAAQFKVIVQHGTRYDADAFHAQVLLEEKAIEVESDRDESFNVSWFLLPEDYDYKNAKGGPTTVHFYFENVGKWVTLYRCNLCKNKNNRSLTMRSGAFVIHKQQKHVRYGHIWQCPSCSLIFQDKKELNAHTSRKSNQCRSLLQEDPAEAEGRSVFFKSMKQVSLASYQVSVYTDWIDTKFDRFPVAFDHQDRSPVQNRNNIKPRCYVSDDDAEILTMNGISLVSKKKMRNAREKAPPATHRRYVALNDQYFPNERIMVGKDEQGNPLKQKPGPKKYRSVIHDSSSDNSSTSDDDNNDPYPKRHGYGRGGGGAVRRPGRGSSRGARGGSGNGGGGGDPAGGAGVLVNSSCSTPGPNGSGKCIRQARVPTHSNIPPVETCSEGTQPGTPRHLNPTTGESTNRRTVTRSTAAREKRKSLIRSYEVPLEDDFSDEDICVISSSNSITDSDSEYEVPNSAKRKARKSLPPLDPNKRQRQSH